MTTAKKIVTFGAAALMGVLSPAMVAEAADTHDYSTYYTLTSTLVASSGEYYFNGYGVLPPAANWIPPSGKESADMTDGEYYLVPSGTLLIARGDKTKHYDDPWPGEELAIQGTFRNHVTNSRNYSPTMPHLALLPGGTVKLHSALSTIKTKDNTLEVRGTVENPSRFDYTYESVSDNVGYYALLEVAIVGDADSAVQFNYTGGTGEALGFQRAFRTTKGFADFLGTLKVDGAYTWLRPEENAENFDIGGTLWVTNGANIYVTGLSPTFGSFVMSDDATLRITNSVSVAVTNSLRLAAGSKIEIESSVFASPEGVLVMRLAPEAVPAGGIDLSGVEVVFVQPGYIELEGSLTTVPDPDVEGGVLVYATPAIVFYNGPNEWDYETYRGKWIDPDFAPDYWSDGLYPDGDKIYCSTQRVFLTADYSIFPGKNLIAKSYLYLTGSSYVTNLYLAGSAFYVRSNGLHFGGNITPLGGTRTIRVLGTRTFYLDAALHGDQDIAFNSYYSEGKGATFHLTADNSDWTGSWSGTWTDRDEGNYPYSIDRHVRIVVGDAKSLGGNPVNFNYVSILMNKYLEIRFTNTTVMTASNRGIGITTGFLCVDEGKTADLTAPVTLNGTLWKRGGGTLGFGGGLRWATNNDLSSLGTPKANKNIVLVEEGAIKASSLPLANVTFSDGTGIAADAASGAMDLTGATVAAEGTICLKADANTLPEPTEEVVYPVVKVSAEQNATLGPAFRAAKVWKGWFGSLVSETDGDSNIVYSVRYEKYGTTISIR